MIKKKTSAETAYKNAELPKHDGWQNPHSSKNPDITVPPYINSYLKESFLKFNFIFLS